MKAFLKAVYFTLTLPFLLLGVALALVLTPLIVAFKGTRRDVEGWIMEND